MGTPKGRGIQLGLLAVMLVAASAIGPLAWGQVGTALGLTPAAAPVPPVAQDPLLVPVTPFRLLDTRTRKSPLGAKRSRVVTVAGVRGTPANAVGAVLNVTLVGATAATSVTVFPTGAPRPATPSVYAGPRQTVVNSVTVLLGSGRVTLFNAAGSVHLLIDVLAYQVGHDHDDRYYSKAQVDAALGGKASASHDHDDRYYSKAQVDAALGGKASASHDHDGRYLEQVQPIVVTDSPRAWAPVPALAATAPTAVDYAGAFVQTTSNGFLWSSVTAPNSVGGTSYRLSSVEYCIEQIDTGAQVDRVVLASNASLLAGLQVASVPDTVLRTSTGCFSLAPIDGGSARSYGILVRFAGDATKRILLGAVRSTWVPAAGAPAAAKAPTGGSLTGD